MGINIDLHMSYKNRWAKDINVSALRGVRVIWQISQKF
jgi:hypothetical protein